MDAAGAGRLILALGLLAAGAACTTQPQLPVPARTQLQAPAPAPAFEPGVELPAGAGREILLASCLSCHELGALALFKGFYTRDSWRALVLTMVENGAEVDGTGVEVLSDYLAQHFGPAQ
jgi:cytochrome c5